MHVSPAILFGVRLLNIFTGFLAIWILMRAVRIGTALSPYPEVRGARGAMTKARSGRARSQEEGVEYINSVSGPRRGVGDGWSLELKAVRS